MSWFLKLVGKITSLIGKIHLPWTKKILHGDSARDILEEAEPCDLILVRTGGWFSAWILDKFFGDYSHAAMCVDRETITDSTEVGVDTRDMLNILIGIFRVAILRPKLRPEEKQKILEAYQWLKKLDAQDNIEYNNSLVEYEIRLDGAPDKLQCSQYMAWLLNKGRINFIEPRKRMGFDSYIPNDFYKAKTKFDLIKEF